MRSMYTSDGSISCETSCGAIRRRWAQKSSTAELSSTAGSITSESRSLAAQWCHHKQLRSHHHDHDAFRHCCATWTDGPEAPCGTQSVVERDSVGARSPDLYLTVRRRAAHAPVPRRTKKSEVALSEKCSSRFAFAVNNPALYTETAVPSPGGATVYGGARRDSLRVFSFDPFKAYIYLPRGQSCTNHS